MQTSAISYRVADFLKQYPPWQCMEQADLLELASQGRVKFHEAGEFILWQDTPLNPYSFVIEHGSVSLWQDSGEGEVLCDMRGTGDIVGIDRYHGYTSNMHSVKSASDAVLYAFPADQVERLLAKYPQAQRYIQAHKSVTSHYSPVDQRKGHHETLLYESIRRVEPAILSVDASLHEAARKVLNGPVAVFQGERLAGILTSTDVVRAVARQDLSGKLDRHMDTAPVIVPPEVTVSRAALALGSTGVMAVTQDGTPTGRLYGLVTVADLGPAFGDHPSEILLEIPRAATCDVLKRIQQRARNFSLEHLTSPAAVDWLAEFLHMADIAILKRLAEMFPPPPGSYCWCLFGAAGRGEAMPAMMQRSVVILGEDASHDAFTAWYQGMQAALMDCGYVARKEHFTPAYSCAPLEEWGRRYSGWILDPLVNSIHAARHLFDLRPAIGDRSLWDRLVTELRAAARQDAGFVRLLANDCLSALPPLTFFRDAVIDESGESSKVFDIERTALRPLADVGRVFGIAAGRLLGASTQERFRLARALLPEQESIFREASETLRVVLTQQARTGIRQQSNGAQLSPELLSQYDRQVLKSGFRSIHTLLEFTAEGTWLDKKV